MSKERLTIKATIQGLSKARKAILRMGYGSKANFAQSVGLGRTTVTKFFQQQPLEYDSFKKICDNLKLNWKDIVEPSDLVETADDKPQEQAFEEQDLSTDIDVLVQDIREKIRDIIKKRCGTMRVLDMTQPIGLNDIYTDVNILEKITGCRRIDLPELVQRFDPDSEDFNRYEMGQVAEKRVPGIKVVNRYSKLMILGKPGAGKTTFLKYLAIQCIDGDFQANKVPIFITLKQFAEDYNQEDIMTFISSFLAEQGVTHEQISQLLIYGRFLFLLDGLDEVREEDSERVIRQISEFANRFSYSRFLKEDSDKLTKNILDKFKESFCNTYLKWLNSLNNELANRGSILNKIRTFFKLSLDEEKNYSIEALKSYIENLDIDEIKDSNLRKYFTELNKLLLEQFQNLRRPEYLKWLESENFREKNKLLKYIKSLLSKHPNEEHKNFINSFSKSLQKFINKEVEDDALSFKNSLLSKFYSNETFINNYLKEISETFPKTCKLSKNIRKLFYEHYQNKHISELIQLLSNLLKKSPSEDYIELFHYQYPERCYANSFVITCRIAAREEKFEKFVEVEVADFDEKQIETFVHKWFQDREPNPSQIFIQQLKSAPPIAELATNPLLLTLLCLVFQEIAEFPSNRSELYKEGIAILLKKWDGQRLIKRDQVYKKLSSPRKEDLLSQIALTTFERKNYFFRQTEAEQYIADYICNLPDAKTDPEALQLDSEAVLKSIEAQHGLLVERARGIYSFSHLTFHEYFTARKIVTTSDPEVLEQALQNLATHITEVRWREVFLLALGILPSADSLLQLMKQQVDTLIARSHNLQQFLKSANHRAILIQGSYKPVVMRAFFFANELSLDQDLSFLLCKEFQLNEDFDIDRLLNHVLNRAFDRTLNRVLLTKDIDIESDLTLFLNRTLNLTLEPKLKQLLQQLKAQMPDITETKDIWNQWWRTQGSAWATQLKAVMNQYSIGQNWQFSEQQEKVLKQYYNANLFLVECLNGDCYVSIEVRKRIEDTLLLPTEEIKKCKQKQR